MEQSEPTPSVEQPQGEDVVDLASDEATIPADELDEFEGDEESRLPPDPPEDD